MKERKGKTAKTNAEKSAPQKRTGHKAEQAVQADKIGLREIYEAFADGFQTEGEKLDVIAARLESIRKTLWRMSDVRNYRGKGDVEARGDGDKAADEAWNLLREFILATLAQFKADVANGRIDMTGKGKPQGEGARND